MSWNYRIGTEIFSYKKTFEGKNEELAKHPDTRLFSLISVLYDEGGVPKSYSYEEKALNHWESMEELFSTYKLIGPAFEKPIIDIDNFPDEWLLSPSNDEEKD